jgi:hypothetical protein
VLESLRTGMSDPDGIVPLSHILHQVHLTHLKMIFFLTIFLY